MDSLTLFGDRDRGEEAATRAAAPPAHSHAARRGRIDLRRAPTQPSTSEVPDPLAAGGPALLAVDGNGLAHRAFHGYARDRRGRLHGFLALLVALVDRVRPSGVLVGFDCPRRSVRREHEPAYKAQRPPHDPGIAALLGAAGELLCACDVTVVTAEGLEADDVVASAARAAEDAGWRSVVGSADRDAYATVSDRTTVADWRRGVERLEAITPARLARRPGVRPGQYTEFAALRGDASDNLHGVDGIGPAKAAALLAAYDTVAEAAADPIGARSVLGRRAGSALLADLAGGDSVFRRNVALMTLRRDVPVEPDACRRTAPAEQVAAACERAGAPAIAGRAAVALGAG